MMVERVLEKLKRKRTLRAYLCSAAVAVVCNIHLNASLSEGQ